MFLCRMLLKRRKILLVSASIVVMYIINYMVWRIRRQGTANLDKHCTGVDDAPKYARNTDNCNQLLLDCYTHGAWQYKPGLTKEMIRERREVDKGILENLGFPRELHREDGRCGQVYRLPLSGLASLCDEDSETSCCNEGTGLCGNANEDCSCPNCKDFSKYIAAEVAEWKPSCPECPYHPFNSKDACAFLNAHVSELVFIGDSFIRHFFVALSLLITGDSLKGALRNTLSEEEKEQCSGELQFVDRGKHSCHLRIIQGWDEFGENQVCGGKAQFKSYLVQAYDMNQLPLAVKAVTNLLGKPKAIVVLGVGIHINFGLNATNVIVKYLKPLLSLIETRGNGKPLVIWANIHRVDNFLTSDNVKNYTPVEHFNKEMSEFCRARSIPVLETSTVTRYIKSNDGRHFGYGGNMAKVQILMNYLKNRDEMCKASHAK